MFWLDKSDLVEYFKHMLSMCLKYSAHAEHAKHELKSITCMLSIRLKQFLPKIHQKLA
jgi:hypothetical protein